MTGDPLYFNFFTGPNDVDNQTYFLNLFAAGCPPTKVGGFSTDLDGDQGGLPLETRANVEAMTMNEYPGGFALFAGTTDGEVFFSEDQGEHWATIARDLAPVSKSGHYRGLRPEWQPVAAG